MLKGNRIVAVSGGFDPVHVGHVRMLQEAKKLGDELVVILNNDHWLRAKKGFAFMPERERAEILRALGADKVYITKHRANDKDRSVVKALKTIRPHIFVNGGDRKNINDIPEAAVCEELDIEMVFNVGGGKIQSSSWLTKKMQKKAGRTRGRGGRLHNHN